MTSEKWQRLNYQPNIPLGEGNKKVTACSEHIDLSKRAAQEGMVLLKNERSELPFTGGTKLALFGKASFDYVKGGGGSGDVTVSYTRNLYEGFKLQGGSVSIYEPLSDFYRENVKAQYADGRVPGFTVEPEVPAELIKSAKAYTDTAVISICRYSGEGWDRRSSYDHGTVDKKMTDPVMIKRSKEVFPKGDFYLTEGESRMIEAVTKNFAHVAVVLNIGGTMDTAWFSKNRKIEAVLLAWQSGIEGGLAAAEILTGKVNPSGRLADTFAERLEDYPSSKTFHESTAYVNYTEDIYVGYRYFETIPGAAKKVVYPFGFGLSYTQFSLKVTDAGERSGEIYVEADVCNTGSAAGKEVIQVYYSAPQGRLGKPARELAAFKKTRLLEPGETQHIRLSFPVTQMASFDDLGKVAKSAYVLESGEYAIYAGTSVENAKKLSYVYKLKNNKVTQQLKSHLSPEQLPERMLADGSYEKLPQRKPNDPNEDVLDHAACARDGLTPTVYERPGHLLWGQEKKPASWHSFRDVADGKCTLDRFMDQLTDEQLARLTCGQPNTGVANTFGYGNLPDYDIPSAMTADGPAGLRIQPECGIYTTAWPCATALACTWNPEIVEQVGEAGGAEVKENNIAFWLTPAVNIHRSPLCGRNFEYYSEDPYLAGHLASAMVRGIQSNHIAATVKHFALNDKETNRRDSDSRASERAIREIYLKQFEIIIKESHPWAVMSSYNIVNGHRASENRELLEDILRGEWGFDGMVTTDWWTLGEQYKEINAGNDAKMGVGYPERVIEAMKKGALKKDTLKVSVKRILETLLKFD